MCSSSTTVMNSLQESLVTTAYLVFLYLSLDESNFLEVEISSLTTVILVDIGGIYARVEVYTYSTPASWVGCDIRSVLKQSTFLLLDWLSNQG